MAKIVIHMKTPDAVDMACQEELGDTSIRDEAVELCKRWFTYGECVRLEVDTEAETCTVLEDA